jgi:hypothetical protein
MFDNVWQDVPPHLLSVCVNHVTGTSRLPGGGRHHLAHSRLLGPAVAVAAVYVSHTGCCFGGVCSTALRTEAKAMHYYHYYYRTTVQ